MLTGNDQHGAPIMQAAHVHEIGHLLGLGHVDIGKPHCPVSGDTNARACYGVADVDKNSVMGGGIRLRDEHAMPWRRAIIQLTGVGSAASARGLGANAHPDLSKNSRRSRSQQEHHSAAGAMITMQRSIRKASAALLGLLCSLMMSCGATQVTPSHAATGPARPRDPCAARLTTTQQILIAVLEHLPRAYDALAGEIVRLQAVETNIYEVWILHEERTDIVTLRAAANSECKVHVTLVSERSERKGAS